MNELMYNYYTITLSGGDEPCVLTYKIQDHITAQIWASLMKQVDVSSLRETLNPWRNFDHTILNQRIEHLESLTAKLNSWLPKDKIIPMKWDYDNHQASVNKFHVHFPEQEKTETDVNRLRQLSEYNDLIHEIEGLAYNLEKNRPHLLVCPDGLSEIPLTDYTHFKARRTFGELCLHYCHVGRHPFELYSANDLNCPVDQIVPQTGINAYHTLRFYDDDWFDHWQFPKFRNFYERSTLKSKMAFEDAKMAFGYITIGKLEKVNNSVDFSNETVYNLVYNSNKIYHWEIH